MKYILHDKHFILIIKSRDRTITYSKIFCSIKIECSDKGNQITLHKVSREPNIIFKVLHTLGISQMYVYRAIDRYNETSSICNKKDLVAHTGHSLVYIWKKNGKSASRPAHRRFRNKKWSYKDCFFFKRYGILKTCKT